MDAITLPDANKNGRTLSIRVGSDPNRLRLVMERQPHFSVDVELDADALFDLGEHLALFFDERRDRAEEQAAQAPPVVPDGPVEQETQPAPVEQTEA